MASQAMKSGAKGAAAAMDWGRVLALTNPEVRKPVTDVLARHSDLRRLIADAKASKPKIHFQAYGSHLTASDGPRLQELENRAATFVPKPLDKGLLQAALLKDQKDLKDKAETFHAMIEQRTAACKEQLAKFDALPHIDKMTVRSPPFHT
jgi:hypothetical protein